MTCRVRVFSGLCTENFLTPGELFLTPGELHPQTIPLGADPRYALVNGISRRIRQETGLDSVTLELEKFDADTLRGLADLLATFPTRIAAGTEEIETDFKSEYAFHNGSIQVGRMHWIKINDELNEEGSGGHANR